MKKSGGYGETDDNDLWGVIQNTNINKKYKLDRWFVPSRAEWSAFGDMLWTQFSVDTNSYEEFGLKGWYWSSSQFDTYDAWLARFGSSYMGTDTVSYYGYVRLSATF